MEIELVTSQQSATAYRFGIGSKENGLMGHAIAELAFEVYGRWVIQTIRIEPRFRSQGYGSRLLDYTCDRLSHICPDIPILIHPALPGFMDEDEIIKRLEEGDRSILDESTKSVNALMDWYRRHGFSGSKVTMVRAPFVLLGRCYRL